MPRQIVPSSPHKLDVAIGQRIRQRRRALGLPQTALAETVGVTFQQIQKYERGANRISFSRLVEIAAALKCQLTDLTEGLDAATPPSDLAYLNELLAHPGALDMLEAYVALTDPGLRRAVLQHARTLAGASKGPALSTGAKTR
ncbi:MAG TPA: helix-turn-helix domain-containing protein [Phenylobacterium sp.]|jgi:transcriptional regulator with XRE-family HTH domain|uniref:helix-turn-helix domain-containing protein n=1 Tax=Phenylobacterium sp. TaxID=1871053 RepID=UPI002D65575B|nr:helix-turn-helix domain-containing protein [Phenylobacterium sp.]HZZ68717.1 helix-turn-helix domain-containing protein [Phenylobacterium sp.]